MIGYSAYRPCRSVGLGMLEGVQTAMASLI